jgi:hypothetical protein
MDTMSCLLSLNFKLEYSRLVQGGAYVKSGNRHGPNLQISG